MVKKLTIYNNRVVSPKPNRPLVPGVCAVIVNNKKEVFMHKRSDADLWSLPGGQMELGESISQCLFRELREETGLKVEIIRLTGVYTSPKAIFEFPDGSVFQSFVVVFLCKAKNWNVTLNEESKAFKWVDLEKLSKLKTLPFVKETIRNALFKKETVFD